MDGIQDERYHEYMLRRTMEENKNMDQLLNNKKAMIWVTFRKEGLHKYPAALDDPKLATGGA